MLPKEKTLTNLWVGPGFLLQLAGLFVQDGVGVGLTMRVAGGIAVLIGCCHYANGKGYSTFVGLIGAIPIVGLLILVLLPDDHKHADSSTPELHFHPPGAKTDESELSDLEQVLFSRIRLHMDLLPSGDREVLVLDGPEGVWSQPLYGFQKSKRLSPLREKEVLQAGGSVGSGLIVRVLSHDKEATRIAFVQFKKAKVMSQGQFEVRSAEKAAGAM